jgi:hypothetical protein
MGFPFLLLGRPATTLDELPPRLLIAIKTPILICVEQKSRDLLSPVLQAINPICQTMDL